MGGFVGNLYFGGGRPKPTTTKSMAKQLHGSRGETKRWDEGPISMVSIGRSQNHFWEDEHQVVLLFGNLYEKGALATQLGLPESAGDAQIFARAWRTWGTGFVSHVDGAFSAAIWKKRDQTLHLLRDPTGTRSLFWTRTHHRFAFATELPALIQAPWVSTEVDRRNLAEYLSFRVIHAPRTMLRDVRSLPAAHTLSLTEEKLEVRQYWRFQYASTEATPPKETDLVDALQSAMNDSVKRRLPQGQMGALYLSGGLGSTAIAAAARTLRRKLPSYTISFDDEPHPESPFAGRVARLLGLEHHVVVVGTAQIANSFNALVQGIGQPVGNPASLLQVLLAQEVGKSARIAFSGDGSVELFGGRMLAGLARDYRAAQRLQRLPMPARQVVSQALKPMPSTRRWLQKKATYGFDLELGGSHLFDTSDREMLLADREDVRPEVRRSVLEPYYQGLDTDPMNAVLNAFVHSWLLEDSLVRSYQTGAMAGVELRFPMLDRRIIEAATALPGSVKVQRTRGSLHTRWPLRAMLKGVLPPPLVNRPKRWMPAPLDAWLAGPGRIFLEERVTRLKTGREDLFEPDAVEQMRSQITRKPGIGAKLWALFILDGWLTALEDNRLRR